MVLQAHGAPPTGATTRALSFTGGAITLADVLLVQLKGRIEFAQFDQT